MPETAEPIRVLHCDDDPGFSTLVKSFLERENGRFVVATASAPADALDRLASEPFDCVVSDYDMPDKDGIELLEAVRESHPQLPFILYTGKGSEEVASDAISAGVTDYLQKGTGTGQYTVLANRIENAVGQYRSRTALEASQKRLSLFIEQSPLGVLEYNEDFEIVRVNDTAEDILGYSEAELRGDTWERLVTEASYDDVDEVTDKLAAAEGGFHSIDENVRKDGDRIVCEWHNRVITDDDGDAVAIFSLFQDVTDRKQYERELEEYEAYLKGSTDIITVLDDTGTIQYQSPSVTRILGYEPEELIGHDGFELVHPEDTPAATDAFTDLLSGPTRTATAEVRVRTADGDWRWFEIRGTDHLDHAEIGGVVINSREVTERKRREQDLEEVNALLSTLVETMPMGVLAEDASREVLATNERLFELFGLPGQPEDVLGDDCERLAREVADLFVDSEGFVERIGEVIEAGASVREERLELEDGRTLARSHEPIELPRGAGHLWVYRDVTDQESRERTLQRQNERLEGFASVVSHDLRNPLSVATGHLELVREEDDDDRLETVATALDRMDQIVGDLLSLARSGDDIGSTAAVDLHDAVEAAWQVADDDGGRLTVTAELGPIEADRTRLLQLLENLFRNAIDHGGDDVTVTVSPLADGFCVTDDGPGIPRATREDAFEPGYTTSTDGTGFGLSIVKQIADAHGWDVRLTSGPDGGARVEVAGVSAPEPDDAGE
jgi:PAS domain S-box-containing protein